MTSQNHHPPGLSGVVSKLAATFVGTLRNRSELFVLEWQEERARFLQFAVLALAAVVLGLMGLVLLTGIIILLCPENIRLYVAGAFALLYFGGSIAAFLILKGMINDAPFSESLNQLNKDREWLQSFK